MSSAGEKTDIQKEVYEWGIKIGRKEAERRLCNAGVGWSMAAKLLAGIYEFNPYKKNLEQIRKAMEGK